MPDAPDRPFTEQETTAIIARAARSQHAIAPTADDGLSLAELQEIGQAAGLSPAHIAAAAAALRAEQGTSAVRFGVPREIRAVRVLPMPVPDVEWERMVAALRAHFEAAGHAGQVGRRREWTAASISTSSGQREEVHVALVPHELGAMLTVEQRHAHRRGRDYLAAGATLGGMGLLFVALPLLGALPMTLAAVGGASILSGAAVGGLGVVSARAWARRRRDGFEALLDRLELIARTAE